MPTSSQPNASAGVAAVLLGLLALLAFDPLRLTTASSAESVTLLFLAVVAALVCYSPLRRHIQEPNSAAFVLSATWFVMYALARRAGPDEGWQLILPAAPETTITISYAARFAVGGALIAAAMNRATLSGFTRAALAAMLLAGVLLLGNFLFLAQFLPVGQTEELNPVPLAHALMQLLEYGAVAVLCGVAATDERWRNGLLKLLPPLLLALWVRHHFAPAAPDEEE